MKLTKGRMLGAAAALALSAGVASAAGRRGAALVDLGRRGFGAERAEEDLEQQGIGWQDMPVAGGGGTQAMTVLRARVTSGNPPTAVQMLGFDIIDWAKEGVLADLNGVAGPGGWDAVVPEALQKFSKYDGHWVAAPVNIHSTNWVWANKAILDELGVKPPQTWDELVAACREGEGRRQGRRRPWRPALAGRDDLRRRRDVDRRPRVLQEGLHRARPGGARLRHDEGGLRADDEDPRLRRRQLLRSRLEPRLGHGDQRRGRLQFMGDWAKGEFLNAGKVPDKDFLCFRFPGTQDQVTFNTDQFAIFKGGDDAEARQRRWRPRSMSPEFQQAFNKVKGSVPARTDVSVADFDACGQKAYEQLKAASTTASCSVRWRTAMPIRRR